VRRSPRIGVGRFERLESREMLTVTYHGGALLKSVEAEAVYLGSDWQTQSSLTAQAAAIDQYVGYVVNSPYMDMLNSAGYNVGRGSATAGATLNLALNKTTGITDASIQSDIEAGIRAGQLAPPDANRLYVVFAEPGVVIKLGSSTSQNSFLGYHGAFAGSTANGTPADIRYAVISYPGSPNPSAGSQGYASVMDDLTSVSSHELAEAVTDPDVNYKQLGWYDDQRGGEIGDLTRQNTRLGSYLVQDVVNKNDQTIAPDTSGNSGGTGGTSGSGGTGGSGGTSGSTSGGTTTGGTTTLSAPTLAGSALTATTAQLSWNAVSGAAGYRVFLIEGSTTTLLGTVSASTTSVTVQGLTAGAQESFRVEAYSGSTVADSNVVALTMPKQQTLSPPQVTAVALSASAVQFSWNQVAGASGYRIYWWNGWRAVYLGTVSAATTSVQISGLPAGRTSQFLVEAYGGGMVADSPWVSITMPRTTRSLRAASYSRFWMG
jgi:hypothetical protein